MSTTAETIRRWWRAFTAWRRDRPFWGGVLTIAGALELLALTAAPLQIMLIRGLAGIGTLVIAAMLIALAIISWTHGHLRVICGVFIVILGLASFAVSNLGGFFIGLLLALVGGSLIFAWQPGKPPDADETATEEIPPVPAAETAEESDRTTADMTVRAPSPVITPAGRAPSRPRLILRVASVLAVVAAAFVAVPQASAQQTRPSADPTWPCPDWPWPWPCDDSSEPDDPGDDDPDDPGDDEPDKPGDDDPDKPEKPDEECDESKLPAKPPKLGTEAAKKTAKALAACLAQPGSGDAEGRDLPTASTYHPLLNADVMTMTGMNSGGAVDVPTADGKQRALEFTMDTLDLYNMDQASGIEGTKAQLHVINMGSSAVLSGGVRLYVQRMEGLIFGVVPIVITADLPLPPIPVPYLVVTEAKVQTAYVRADRVDLPDLEEPTR
ncbi:DUF6114 domain-containing protein [Stackebrandtia nassauensis]|uniref:Uncharacterized protein n=1 Tax=Stackebrandtia nassauensis (strain DSM 44728 / CIP 108903 / NRRL B-16338 / NBRC 102104 / LLR-40K-21) TaxID=446470 RepID=D3QAB0_STANL|nr:DUF6114 domain-containing protein [Stackebrandtia nassauensis]ADD42693.1 hypothetical protein Snas_3022 [Stackebrandtia nassauensis DSM 44728]